MTVNVLTWRVTVQYITVWHEQNTLCSLVSEQNQGFLYFSTGIMGIVGMHDYEEGRILGSGMYTRGHDVIIVRKQCSDRLRR
jgi:hypothetical protein